MPTHRVLLTITAIAALVVGVGLGYLLATSITCGEGCVFNVALFDAVGTWVSGLGVSAVGGWFTLNANAARRAEKAARERAEKDEREAARLREARILAIMCTLRYQPLGDPQNGYERVSIEFQNKLEEPVFWPDIVLSDGTRLGGEDEQVFPSRAWGKKTQLAKLEIEAKYPTELAAREAINATGRDTVVFEFTIRGYRFARTGREVVALGRVTAEPPATGTMGAPAVVGGQP